MKRRTAWILVAGVAAVAIGAAAVGALALMLRGAIEAQGRVGLMLNVQKEHLPQVLAVLPALNSPTVSDLNLAGWVAVNVASSNVSGGWPADIRR